MSEFQVLTLDQVTYDATSDRRCTLEEGLERRDAQGWVLVTSYQGTDYVDQPGVWMFVFKRAR